jgi:hypothetical protein
MAWGIVMQEPAPAQISPEQLQKIQRIARVCNSQCSIFISSCTGRNLKGCYQASACKCECNLQQDPANADSGAWRQCVQRYTTFAESLDPRNADLRP